HVFGGADAWVCVFGDCAGDVAQRSGVGEGEAHRVAAWYRGVSGAASARAGGRSAIGPRAENRGAPRDGDAPDWLTGSVRRCSLTGIRSPVSVYRRALSRCCTGCAPAGARSAYCAFCAGLIVSDSVPPPTTLVMRNFTGGPSPLVGLSWGRHITTEPTSRG